MIRWLCEDLWFTSLSHKFVEPEFVFFCVFVCERSIETMSHVAQGLLPTSKCWHCRHHGQRHLEKAQLFVSQHCQQTYNLCWSLSFGKVVFSCAPWMTRNKALSEKQSESVETQGQFSKTTKSLSHQKTILLHSVCFEEQALDQVSNELCLCYLYCLQIFSRTFLLVSKSVVNLIPNT